MQKHIKKAQLEIISTDGVSLPLHQPVTTYWMKGDNSLKNMIFDHVCIVTVL